MILVASLVLASLGLGGAASAQQSAKAGATQEKTLYQRLGGYDAIAAVTDDFLHRLLSDPRLAPYFNKMSTNTQNRVRQLIVELLCRASDGPCNYTGRSMRMSHAGLGITDAEWQAAVAHLTESLDKFHVPKEEKEELLGYVSLLRPDIVQK
jgi:hemoglobin